MGTNKQKKIGLVVVLMLLSIGFISVNKTATALQTTFNAGTITISGPTNNAYVKCTPTDLNIKVRPNGNTVTIQVAYSMNCPGTADDGYCYLYLDNKLMDSRHTGGTDSGYLSFSTYMNPTEIHRVTLFAEYTDYLGATILGKDIENATITVGVVQPPIAAFSYSPSTPNKGDSVQFSDTSSSVDTNIVSWSWNFGDGSSSTARDPMHQYSNTGTYTVTLQVTDDYSQTSQQATRTITVNAIPIADFSFSPDAPTTASTIQFTDSSRDSDGSIASWSWDFGDSTSGSIGQNPSHQYQKAGTYTITLQVTDNNGATNTKTATITIKDKGIPGFELIAVIGAIAVIFLCKRSRKKDNQ